MYRATVLSPSLDEFEHRYDSLITNLKPAGLNTERNQYSWTKAMLQGVNGVVDVEKAADATVAKPETKPIMQLAEEKLETNMPEQKSREDPALAGAAFRENNDTVLGAVGGIEEDPLTNHMWTPERQAEENKWRRNSKVADAKFRENNDTVLGAVGGTEEDLLTSHMWTPEQQAEENKWKVNSQVACATFQENNETATGTVGEMEKKESIRNHVKQTFRDVKEEEELSMPMQVTEISETSEDSD